MAKFNAELAFRVTFAGFCGIVGFITTYALLDWLLEPLEKWIDKLQGGTK